MELWVRPFRPTTPVFTYTARAATLMSAQRDARHPPLLSSWSATMLAVLTQPDRQLTENGQEKTSRARPMYSEKLTKFSEQVSTAKCTSTATKTITSLFHSTIQLSVAVATTMSLLKILRVLVLMFTILLVAMIPSNLAPETI